MSPANSAKRLLSILFALLAVPCLADERSSDEQLSLALGTRYFDQICRATVGNPDQFHRLIAASGLTPMEFGGPDVESWGGRLENVKVVVQYTKTMTCFVYMSHAKEADVRRHVIDAVKAQLQQGALVKIPTSPATEPAGSSVLRFHVESSEGKYMLMALYRAGDNAALVVGPYR